VIEIGSALTVLCASNLGIPISTTHCKVGSVVMVGRVRSREHVDWLIFRNVILVWVVTMPFAGQFLCVIVAPLKGIVQYTLLTKNFNNFNFRQRKCPKINYHLKFLSIWNFKRLKYLQSRIELLNSSKAASFFYGANSIAETVLEIRINDLIECFPLKYFPVGVSVKLLFSQMLFQSKTCLQAKFTLAMFWQSVWNLSQVR